MKDSASATPIKINQDANIFVTELSKALSFDLKAGRQAYLLCVEGACRIACGEGSSGVCPAVPNGKATADLSRHDAAEIFGPCRLLCDPSPNPGSAATAVHLLIVEMAFTGPGRTDLRD